MFYEIALRVVEPFLGDVEERGGTRRFARKKEPDGLALYLPQWHWAIRAAAKALDVEFDFDCLRLPDRIPAPRLNLYRRQYGTKEGRAAQLFECVQTRTILTLEIFLLPKQKELEEQLVGEFREIMQLVGTTIGLSPWGSHFGYGRFKVESLMPVPAEGLRHRIRASGLKLPEDFVVENAEYSRLFLGHRLGDLSKRELIAVVSHLSKQIDVSSHSG